MAYNFDAHQFNDAFRSKRLQNWETAKWNLRSPLSLIKGPTKIISNDRGHLLPEIKRPKTNAWGKFKNTCHLPKKISRDQAFEISNELAGCPSKEFLLTGRSKHDRQDVKFIAGDVTEPTVQHSNRENLLDRRHDQDSEKSPSEIKDINESYSDRYPRKKDILRLPIREEGSSSNICTKLPQPVDENVKDNIDEMPLGGEIPDKPNQRYPSPLIPAYCNFQMAKKMHQDNLDHQPLPDSVMDKAFRKLQAEDFKYPGLALDVNPMASGVGVKTYKAGPTHCTKLRVFRPKTCGVVPRPISESGLNFQQQNNRPYSSSATKEKLGAMDLAICWDYRPLNPHDEPKPTKHIDGSNGSEAPAIFTLVKTPRTPEKLETGRSCGIFANTLGNEGFFDKDILRHKTGFGQRSRSGGDLLKCSCGKSLVLRKDDSAGIYRSKSASRTIQGEEKERSTLAEDIIRLVTEKRKRCKSSPNLSKLAVAGSDCSSSCKENQSHFQNREDQRRQHTCSKYGPRKVGKAKRIFQQHKVGPAPELEGFCQDKSSTELHKMAFRAGIPQRNSSGTVISHDSGCSTAGTSTATCSLEGVGGKGKNAPKQRNPYPKRNYNIETLVAPFQCLSGGAGQGGYPEHWRLASVYQHSYKPVELRKRSLLQTVYK